METIEIKYLLNFKGIQLELTKGECKQLINKLKLIVNIPDEINDTFVVSGELYVDGKSLGESDMVWGGTLQNAPTESTKEKLEPCQGDCSSCRTSSFLPPDKSTTEPDVWKEALKRVNKI